MQHDAAPWIVTAYTSGTWLYGLVAVLLIVEAAAPLRRNAGDSPRRWALHAALCVVAALLAWGLAGALAQLGVLIRGAPPAPWAGWWHLALMLLALDAATYAMHRINHRVALLWRFHSLHHADTMLDIGTTVRHHPAEVVISGLATGLVALALGARPTEVAAYAVLSLTVQIAAHANLRFPPGFGWLSAVLITPSLHHLHTPSTWP